MNKSSKYKAPRKFMLSPGNIGDKQPLSRAELEKSVREAGRPPAAKAI